MEFYKPDVLRAWSTFRVNDFFPCKIHLSDNTNFIIQKTRHLPKSNELFFVSVMFKACVWLNAAILNEFTKQTKTAPSFLSILGSFAFMLL